MIRKRPAARAATEKLLANDLKTCNFRSWSCLGLAMTKLRILSAVAVALITSSTIAFAENCDVAENAVDRFLPQTSAPRNALPNPPTNNDCAFYNWAWQTFLFVTQPSTFNRAAFLSYETIEDVFGKAATRQFATVNAADRQQRNILSLAPRGAKRQTQIPTLDGGFKQAGDLDAILVDQNRNAIYYSVHLNSEYARFVRDNRLNDLDHLLMPPKTDPEKDGGPPANLQFRTGAVELKAAWQIVEPGDDRSSYFTTRANVPLLKNAAGKIVRDGEKTREVTVALLGLHVVGVIDGHPEFIWTSFEHADATGARNIAPAAKANPVDGNSQTQEIGNSGQTYPLFHMGDTAATSNRVPATYVIDEASQKFSVATSVYREYPGSQAQQPSDGERDAPFEDPAVFTLNRNIGVLFDKDDPSKTDLRRNYRLVAAVWIDDPDKLVGTPPAKTFREKARFDDDVLAGENRMSNMAMESFTQDANASPNCFSCHDTRQSDPVAPGKRLPARRINVSHVFELFAKSALGVQ
jgi:hypothetical protein